MSPAGIEKVFLPQMTKWVRQPAGNLQMIVDNQMNACGFRDAGNVFRHSLNLVGIGRFGSQLNDIGPAVAKLAGYFYCRTALKVVGIDKGVETALKQGFHPQKVNPTKDSSWLLFDQLTSGPAEQL